jgi:hypothetical protein
MWNEPQLYLRDYCYISVKDQKVLQQPGELMMSILYQSIAIIDETQKSNYFASIINYVWLINNSLFLGW